MASNYDDADGVWRTIGGRRVFIRTGQSLSDAMIQSGKFKNLRSDYRKAKEEDNKKIVADYQNGNIERDEMLKKFDNDEDKMKKAFEELGYKAPTKENIDATNKRQAEIQAKQEAVNKSFEENQRQLLEENNIKDDNYYNNLGQYEVYEQAEKLANETNDYELRSEINKKLDSIDRANRKGAGYGQKPTNELREILKENQKQLQSKLTDEEKANVKEVMTNKDLQKQVAMDVAKSFGAKEVKVNGETINLEDKPSQEVLDAVRSSYIYKDEKSTEKYIEQEKQKYGDKAVEDAFKYYDDNYVLVKGTNADSEGLTYNDMIDKKEYPIEAINEYKRSIDNLRASGLQYDNYAREYNKKAQEFRDKLEASKNKETFTQQIDMHGGTREYTKEDLDKMKDAGIKPMEHSYTGGGWEGVNSDKYMDTKDQAKAITDAMKKQFPDVKILRRSDNFSGGSAIDFNIMSSDKDLFVSDADIDKMEFSDFGRLSASNGFEWWAKDNVPNYQTEHSYTIDDVRKYAKYSLAENRKRDIQSPDGDEWYLSDYGKKVVSALNKEANSYTYNDSDGMYDYFDHGTYMHVNIGKWDKPYEVKQKTMNDKIRDEAYRKYMKDHPNSKMTLDKFLKKK